MHNGIRDSHSVVERGGGHATEPTKKVYTEAPSAKPPSHFCIFNRVAKKITAGGISSHSKAVLRRPAFRFPSSYIGSSYYSRGDCAKGGEIGFNYK